MKKSNDTMINELKKEKIENILIFVSDAHRWDYCPNKMKEMGFTFKTIASSLYTASSFPSIVSGLYPPKHRVYSWEDKLNNKFRGIFNFKGYNNSLWCENTWIQYKPIESAPIYRILSQKKQNIVKRY
jgi:hypothetical protein